MVFDDKFQTVFNNRKTEEQQDTICEILFQGCRECCVEKEYNKSGILNYEPPPFNKVWLSKSEQHDRKASLQKQCRRNKRQQRDLASQERKRCIERFNNYLPALTESTVESDSDCDSLPDQDSVSKAGGGDSVIRDLSSDHPM